ncbi:hypothetical protein AJ80_05628 [Polytolypa hystricis UAMH7299]|uniref:NmrA-like domain-containing protein n=1 Tax=Polytolypa hystricis (strain UAMH7299) TaxID=1447883 RepID=A0A2B7Y253_POLH7|nr:hypothetical protein AJ80_05628 [Polytolypa hystricis UAMH7299]
MSSSEDTRPAVAIAGAGDVAKFFVEELLKDGRYRIIVLSRAERPWFIRPSVSLHITDYTHPSILSILTTTLPIALFSFIHSDEPQFYNPVHAALLSACTASPTCHKLIPSEYGGNITNFPNLPRFYTPTHSEVRNLLRAQEKVKWTLVNGGWFMDYFLPAEKSYMKPLPGVWPIDLQRSKALILGTGEEKIGWTAARDVAKALVRLVEVDELEEYTYIAGEIGTWNAAIQLLEDFRVQHHNLPKFSHRKKSVAEIEQEIKDRQSDTSGLLKVSEMDEWNVAGASAVPWSEVERQREKFFKGIKFRAIRELLEDGEKVGIV